MIALVEHFQFYNLLLEEETDKYLLDHSPGHFSKYFQSNKDKQCFSIGIVEDETGNKSYKIETSYFVGVDRISGLGRNVLIEPKLNNENTEVNVYHMLFEAMSDSENFRHLDGLYEIKFNSNPILIQQKQDYLTPFLLIQYVKLLSALVKKGLKKSYYRKSENLNSKIKGKILINQHINRNVLKNNKTNTFCEFEVFGFDITQNQFLKYVLRFVSGYLEKYPADIRGVVTDLFNYIQPAFVNVSERSFASYDLKEKNPFYAEYNNLFEIGNLILKVQSFNTAKSNSTERAVPPYWIDMSKLFELYVFKKLRDLFPEKDAVMYHRKFLGGKETDIILRSNGFECVIDCKYKPRYADSPPSLEDYRQLAGYCRMKSVYKILNKPYTEVLKGIIIYSDQGSSQHLIKENFYKKNAFEYVDFYKIGISLPTIQ